MKNFFSINDAENPEQLAQEAIQLKSLPMSDEGNNKSICLIFFNPSLRTRLSSIRAAENLGMNVSVFNVGEDGWQLEFEDGAIMDKGKSEHIKEAAPVISSYFDIIGIRSFPILQSKQDDYKELVLMRSKTIKRRFEVHSWKSLSSLVRYIESHGYSDPLPSVSPAVMRVVHNNPLYEPCSLLSLKCSER